MNIIATPFMLNPWLEYSLSNKWRSRKDIIEKTCTLEPITRVFSLQQEKWNNVMASTFTRKPFTGVSSLQQTEKSKDIVG
jgi:hypothetical protein